jgi:uncharacterized membrane protein HdeD (DUF308 family)
MNALVAGQWWGVALRGLVAILFGVLALTWPGLTLDALVLLFGVFVLADGISILIDLATNSGRRKGSRGMLVLQALVSIAAGIVTFLWPGITAVALVFVIAAWALVTGLLELSTAFRLRRAVTNEWLLIVDGVLSVLIAVALLINPAAGAIALVWVIGWFAILSGVLLIALSFRLRKEQSSVGMSRTAPSAP